jgi:hypothetical protein
MACSQVSLHDKLALDHIPDTAGRLESTPVHKVFLVELKCAEENCAFPVPILAATGPSMGQRDFAQLENGCLLAITAVRGNLREVGVSS